MLVEDDEDSRKLLSTMLKRYCARVTATKSAAEAFRSIDSDVPDLVISDVIMPDMNGIEAAIHIRKFLPACKVLLFSGQAATADLLESARSQGHEFEILAKPVHPQDLLANLRA